MALDEKNPIPAGSAAASSGSHADTPDEEKPDLLDYLAGLPDVEMDTSFPNEEKKDPEPQPEEKAENRLETLAALIRSRAKAAQITPLAALRKEDSGVLEDLNALAADEAYKDIVCIKGDNDSYYYSDKTMTTSFANIAALVEEKNDARTLAHSVRERSRYPALTYAHFFMDYPFYFSASRMEQIKQALKADSAYEDIQVFKYANVEFFYSTQSLKPEIASYLADELLNARP